LLATCQDSMPWC